MYINVLMGNLKCFLLIDMIQFCKGAMKFCLQVYLDIYCIMKQ